jgi:CheY-like chemotaxis protein
MDELEHSPAQALIANLPPGEQTALADRFSDLPYGTPAITCWVPGEDEIAHRLGVVRYLVKPIATEQILTALADLGSGIETVLIADDEPEALQLFGRMLATAPTPYRILRARNGHRALSLMRDRQPDAVLLDLMMPQMDGFQVLEAKRQDSAIQEIPVIIISSRDPSGEPIVSNTLSLTGSHGLSVPEILACTQAVSEILTPTGPNDRARPGNPAG